MARDPNWKIKNLGGRSAEVLLFDEIGGWFGTSAKDFAQEITDLDVDNLTVRINSPGGDVFDGIAIMNALKQNPAHVTARVEGLAASAASIIAVGGADEVIMGEASQMMIHDAWSFGFGNAADLLKLAGDLDRTSDTLAGIYARKAGTPQEEWRDLMREETWYTAEEAVSAGLANRSDTDEDADADSSLAAFSRGRVMALFKHRSRGDAPAPKITPPHHRKESPVALNHELARMLGMTATNPTDDDIKAAIQEALDEQAEDLEDNDTGDSVAEAEAALAAAREAEATKEEAEEVEEVTSSEEDTVVLDKAVYEDLLARAAAGDDATEEAKQNRAANLIDTEGIKTGRLLGWQRDSWVAKATENYEATKTELLRLAPGVLLSEKGRAGSDTTKSEQALAKDDQAATHARADKHDILSIDNDLY